MIPIDGRRGLRQPGSMNATTADARSVTGQPQILRLRRAAEDKMLAGVT